MGAHLELLCVEDDESQRVFGFGGIFCAVRWVVGAVSWELEDYEASVSAGVQSCDFFGFLFVSALDEECSGFEASSFLPGDESVLWVVAGSLLAWFVWLLTSVSPLGLFLGIFLGF